MEFRTNWDVGCPHVARPQYAYQRVEDTRIDHSLRGVALAVRLTVRKKFGVCGRDLPPGFVRHGGYSTSYLVIPVTVQIS